MEFVVIPCRSDEITRRRNSREREQDHQMYTGKRRNDTISQTHGPKDVALRTATTILSFTLVYASSASCSNSNSTFL